MVRIIFLESRGSFPDDFLLACELHGESTASYLKLDMKPGLEAPRELGKLHLCLERTSDVGCSDSSKTLVRNTSVLCMVMNLQLYIPYKEEAVRISAG